MPPDPLTVAYGDGPSCFGQLWLPDQAGRHPVVALIHGGFWRATYGLDLMEPLAADLVGRGAAAWNIEYRRVGEQGGGWPATLADVAAAIDHLVELEDHHRLDLGPLAVVGHSAGGHLALWSGGRDRLPAGTPGAEPRVMPSLVVGQAPAAHLREVAARRLSNDAAAELLGGSPGDVPERYDHATPRLDGSVRALVVHGDADENVPIEVGVPPGAVGVEQIIVGGADHFDVIDPAHESWLTVVEHLDLPL